jgi:hypothetical protein
MELKYASGIFGLVVEDEINWEVDKIVSYSQYSKYKKCPKSWELRYVRKHKVPAMSIHFVYGTAMHRVIQEYLHTCYTKSVKASNEMDLPSRLMELIKEEYMQAVTESGSHFSSKEQLSEFYKDGCEILNFIKKKRTAYFSTKDTVLIGVELPLTVKPDPKRPNILLQQHLDLVFYDKKSNKYTIMDIKTATRGWNQYKRKDKDTVNQIVLYKKHFCDKFNIDPKNVNVVYFILRQKIDEDSLWSISRVSEFKPSAGSLTIKQLTNSFQSFLDDCFDSNGQYIDKSHPAYAGKNGWNCTYCEYNEREDLCPTQNRINNV